MKKTSIIVVLIICIFSFCECVNADLEYADYKCVYTFYKKGTSGNRSLETGILNVDTRNKKFISEKTGPHFVGSDDNWLHVIDRVADSTYTDEYLIDQLDGKCLSQIYICPGVAQHSSWYLAILNPQLITSFPYKETNFGDRMALGHAFSVSNCDIAKLDKSKSTGKIYDIEFKCDYFNYLYNGNSDDGVSGLKDLYCRIDEDGCNIGRINQYNEQKEKLITYCKSMLQIGDYVNPCVSECANYKLYIAEIEGSSVLGECGVPAKILVWANNILKWVKYILPVLVIIFGIIDFIKAMASNNDDEMEKAKKHFTIRLIAAVLTFVIPLIISFILNKMGFTAEACGIDVLK